MHFQCKMLLWCQEAVQLLCETPSSSLFMTIPFLKEKRWSLPAPSSNTAATARDSTSQPCWPEGHASLLQMPEWHQALQVLQQWMLQAGPWQLRYMNGSSAKIIHAARCGGQVMICFSWGRGPAHGPTSAPDAHDNNFKLAKEVQWLASLMTTVRDTEHHCAYSVTASCSLLWSIWCWEVINVSFRGAQASTRGEAIHTADEVQARQPHHCWET